MAIEGHHVTTDSGFARGTSSIVNPGGSLQTTVDTAVGVLVADAASPTQAHVNTLNTAWTASKSAGTAVGTGGLSIFFDTTKITTKGQLKIALDAFMDRIRGSNILKD